MRKGHIALSVVLAIVLIYLVVGYFAIKRVNEPGPVVGMKSLTQLLQYSQVPISAEEVLYFNADFVGYVFTGKVDDRYMKDRSIWNIDPTYGFRFQSHRFSTSFAKHHGFLLARQLSNNRWLFALLCNSSSGEAEQGAPRLRSIYLDQR